MVTRLQAIPAPGMILGMDLEELRGFMAVAESGSFLAAATQLRVPRGTLRRRIDSLEARAGVALFLRNPRGVALTEAGDTLVARGRRLLREGEALLAAVRASARPSDAPLRLRIPVGLPPGALIDFARLARVLSPARNLEVQVCEAPLEKLEELDLALVLGEAEPPVGWLLRELRRVTIHVVASESYLERHGPPQTIEHLHDHRLAAWTGPQLDPRAWPALSGPNAYVAVTPSLITNDIHALHDFAARGLGLALVPHAGSVALEVPDLSLHTVLSEQIGAELALQVAISEASNDREHVERAATLIADLSRDKARLVPR